MMRLARVVCACATASWITETMHCQSITYAAERKPHDVHAVTVPTPPAIP